MATWSIYHSFLHCDPVFSRGLDAEVAAFNKETLLNVFLYPATVQAGANKKSLTFIAGAQSP